MTFKWAALASIVPLLLFGTASAQESGSSIVPAEVQVDLYALLDCNTHGEINVGPNEDFGRGMPGGDSVDAPGYKQHACQLGGDRKLPVIVRPPQPNADRIVTAIEVLNYRVSALLNPTFPFEPAAGEAEGEDVFAADGTIVVETPFMQSFRTDARLNLRNPMANRAVDVLGAHTPLVTEGRIVIEGADVLREAEATAPAHAHAASGVSVTPRTWGGPAPAPGGGFFESAAQSVGVGQYLPPLPDQGIVVGGIILTTLGAALYQRFSPATSFQHERRAAIHRSLADWPEGATAGDVARRLGMNRKTVDYHLTYLVRLDKVRESIDETGARRYSLRPLPERRPLVERVVDLIRERPGMSVMELADALQVSRSAADRHAKALVIQGSLESRLVEGERRLFLPA